MDIAGLLKVVASVLVVGYALLGLVVCLLRKTQRRESWLAALAPVLLAAAFVSGYAMVLEFPRKWPDEAWKMGAVAVAAAGLLFTSIGMLTRDRPAALRMIGSLLAMLVLAWLTTMWFREARGMLFGALAGALAAYLVALRPAMRHDGPWATPPTVLMISGFSATVAGLVWVDMNTGRLMMMTTALCGLVLVGGIVRALRPAARGSASFLAAAYGCVLTLLAYYNPGDIPLWIFAWLGAGPLAGAVAHLPPLKRRPWVCAIVAAALALCIVVPALMVAAKYAPTM